MARALVIGAGHQGLVCAARVAAGGHEVTVLEASAGPGGGVTSGEDTLPGFVHDRCAAFFPLTRASPVLRDLDGVAWVDPQVPMAHVLDGGRAVALHRDVEATAAGLEAVAPGGGAAWRGMVGELWPARDALVRAALSRFPPVRPGLELALGLRLGALRLGLRMADSAGGLGRRLFGDDRAAAWLAGSTAHSDLGPGTPGGAAFGFGLNFLGHLVGWPFPRGGAARLTDVLVERVRAGGGQVRCGVGVERIETPRRRAGPAPRPGAKGARPAARVWLRSGERLEADAVVATLSPAPLLAALDPGSLPPGVEWRLRRWRYGLGTLKLDWALSGPVPWSAPVAREAGVVHVGGGLDQLTAAHSAARSGRLPARPSLVVGQHSLHDPSRAPAGSHTLYAYARVPGELAGGADEGRADRREAGPDPPTPDGLADLVERRIEEFAPGFRALVLARHVRLPAQLERDDPALVGGDLSAGSVAPDQALFLRPHPRLCRYRTPVAGLYVAGAATHPGPGVHGVSGRGAADAVLQDLARPAGRRFRIRSRG